jgi:hypothetical protein
MPPLVAFDPAQTLLCLHLHLQVAATADKQIHVYDLTAGSKAAEFKSPLAYQTKCLSIFTDKCVHPPQLHSQLHCAVFPLAAAPLPSLATY